MNNRVQIDVTKVGVNVGFAPVLVWESGKRLVLDHIVFPTRENAFGAGKSYAKQNKLTVIGEILKGPKRSNVNN